MKKNFNILFILILSIISISVASAGSYIFTSTTTLSNTIVDNKVTNYPLTRTDNMGRYFNTWIKNVQNVRDLNGANNASGGIRTFVRVKRKNLLLGFDEERQMDVYSSTKGISLFWDTKQGGKKETTVSWQNKTGNTSYKGTFEIEEL